MLTLHSAVFPNLYLLLTRHTSSARSARHQVCLSGSPITWWSMPTKKVDALGRDRSQATSRCARDREALKATRGRSVSPGTTWR